MNECKRSRQDIHVCVTHRATFAEDKALCVDRLYPRLSDVAPAKVQRRPVNVDALIVAAVIRRTVR